MILEICDEKNLKITLKNENIQLNQDDITNSINEVKKKFHNYFKSIGFKIFT